MVGEGINDVPALAHEDVDAAMKHGAMLPEYAPGVVVTERASASALPMLGAIGGASVNYIFMKHFQRVAHGHFSVRRLERRYGFEVVHSYYRELAARHSGPTRPPDLARIGRTR